MAVSKRLRFEVFKRDGFRCLYCGASPVTSTLTVKLQADHVDPRAKGGEDDAANLVTACVDCNQGKSDIRLDDKRFRSSFASEEEREHAQQIREYLKIQREIVEAKRDAEAIVLEHWEDRIGEFHWQLPRFIPGAIREFGIERTTEAVDIVARRGIPSPMEQVRYFCGILRNWRQPRTVAPAMPPVTEENVRQGRWEIAITYVETYCQYRWAMDERPKLDALIRAAIGSTKEKPAPLSIRDLYIAADHAAWAGEPRERYWTYVTPEEMEGRFRRIVEDALAGREPIERDTYVAHNYEQTRWSEAMTHAQSFLDEWLEMFGSEASQDAQVMFAEVIDTVTLPYLRTVVRGLQSRLSGKPMEQQLADVRRRIVDELFGDGIVFPHALIRAWPEWKQRELKAVE